MSGVKIALTADKVRNLFDYDPVSGLLAWKISPSNRVRLGDPVGTVDSKGYGQVQIDCRKYRTHRIIWLWMTGNFPSNQIDHKNRQRMDNRWENLRDVSRQENSRNLSLSRKNKSGIIGVYWRNSNQKWHAQITVSRKNISLGFFSNIQDAAEARKIAETKYGFYYSHGLTAHS